jgi:hypothetical protein
MSIQGVERMSRKHRSRPTRFVAIIAALALTFAALSLAGCGGTVESPGGPSGTGAPQFAKVVPEAVRGEILDRLKAMGVTFDAGLVSVAYGSDASHIVVNGPMTAPENIATSGKGGALATFSELDLALQGGVWVVTRTLK